MRGRLTYITTLASTPLMSPLTVADVFSLTDVFAESIGPGLMQDIYFYWGYNKFDPYHTDQRNVSRSASGIVEITNFLSTEGFKFDVPNIVQDRLAQVNEYAIMQALNDELMNGVVLTWYPDFEYSALEYYSCIAEQRLDPVRQGMLFKWTFSFDLAVLPSVQVPSTVPDFVLA